MSFLISTVLVFLLVSLAVLVRAIAHAPEGYEDATGFHFSGKSPAPERPSRQDVHAHAFAEAPMPKHAA